ncbi:MAG TPA: hypothetical protein VGL82_04645 [Bryobacteraceae bacterium]|jgi:hypothetical protein
MFIAFSLQVIFLVGATTLGRTGDTMWVVLIVLVFLTGGELYVLFPAALADLYGTKNSALNYSFLYSAKSIASLLGSGIVASLFEKTETWNYAFRRERSTGSALGHDGSVCPPGYLPQKRERQVGVVQPAVG